MLHVLLGEVGRAATRRLLSLTSTESPDETAVYIESYTLSVRMRNESTGAWQVKPNVQVITHSALRNSVTITNTPLWINTTRFQKLATYREYVFLRRSVEKVYKGTYL